MPKKCPLIYEIWFIITSSKTFIKRGLEMNGYNYPQQPSFQGFMRQRMQEAQTQAEREYYDMINGRQQQQTAPNIQQQSQSYQPPIQPISHEIPSIKPNAHSIQVNSKEQAEAYPVNKNLEDMFFIADDTIYVKTFDLGKGKWNDMKIYKLDSYVHDTSQDIDNKYETLKQFVIQEISELKAELQRATKVDDELEQIDEEEFEEEEIVVKKPTVTRTAKKTTTPKKTTTAKTTNKTTNRSR
jgi:hypothetical protein